MVTIGRKLFMMSSLQYLVGFLGCVVCGDSFGAFFEPWDEITIF